ncbi:MAG: hypothetical protein CHACPFDD_02578 [Phycisphaerae bacterium]|nr:hypothetical protein [Phycisphaerae bacterium]
MSEHGLTVKRYSVAASFARSTVNWMLVIETDGGERHTIEVVDGAEVQLMLDVLRKDKTMYYDPRTRSLSTGWNAPGF